MLLADLAYNEVQRTMVTVTNSRKQVVLHLLIKAE